MKYLIELGLLVVGGLIALFIVLGVKKRNKKRKKQENMKNISINKSERDTNVSSTNEPTDIVVETAKEEKPIELLECEENFETVEQTVEQRKTPMTKEEYIKKYSKKWAQEDEKENNLFEATVDHISDHIENDWYDDEFDTTNISCEDYSEDSTLLTNIIKSLKEKFPFLQFNFYIGDGYYGIEWNLIENDKKKSPKPIVIHQKTITTTPDYDSIFESQKAEQEKILQQRKAEFEQQMKMLEEQNNKKINAIYEAQISSLKAQLAIEQERWCQHEPNAFMNVQSLKRLIGELEAKKK